jgi:hypothetical protein
LGQQAKGRSQEAATASTSQLQSQLEAAAKLTSTLESTTTLESFLESTESTLPHPLVADEAEAIDPVTLEANKANKAIGKPKKGKSSCFRLAFVLLSFCFRFARFAFVSRNELSFYSFCFRFARFAFDSRCAHTWHLTALHKPNDCDSCLQRLRPF